MPETKGSDRAGGQAGNAGGMSKGRRWLFGASIGGGVALFLAGIVFWGGFNTAMEATNTLEFCISCHEMESTVYQEYKNTIHYQNRTGVSAVCSDCHVPDPWVHKMVRKIQASKEVWGKITGTINTPEKFEAKRLELAKNVWSTMKQTDSRECRNCHNFESMAPEFQRPRARQQHLNAFETGQTCIDCHKGIAHKHIRDLLEEEELEALEKPNPAFVRDVPEIFTASLKKVQEREAEEAAKAEAEAKAADEATKARIERAVSSAVDKAVAEAVAAERAKIAADGGTVVAEAPAADAAADKGESVAGNVNWDAVEGKAVTLFYPGQTSFEWIQTGKDHGGARAVTKAGDRCSTCHAKEVKDMGAKLVSGEKAEETPIPGKRPFIETTVQATHDADNLYLRFQWMDGEHAPAPFVDGGKMDPDNQVKVAMMIAGTGIEYAEQAGCWVTCHHDSRRMPDAPDAEALGGAGDVAGRIDLHDGVTKYIAESRTKVEVAGRRGKVRGGWDKLKDQGEIDALVEAGTFLDLMRYRSGAKAENGQVLMQRDMNAGVQVEAEGSLDGGMWTVVLKRPLTSAEKGDISLEAGKTYMVGFAIHDDYANARFHHVSLEFTLGLDNPEAEINVVGQ